MLLPLQGACNLDPVALSCIHGRAGIGLHKSEGEGVLLLQRGGARIRRLPLPRRRHGDT